MSSDKGTNYFSAEKRETESDGNSVRTHKTVDDPSSFFE